MRVAEASRGLAMTAAQDGLKVWDLRSGESSCYLYTTIAFTSVPLHHQTITTPQSLFHECCTRAYSLTTTTTTATATTATARPTRA